jgi:hypothetical protein
MDENLVTVRDILEHLKSVIKNKVFLDAHNYVEYATRLNLLISDEHDKLFELQQKVSERKAGIMSEGKSASYAKIVVEATDEYKEMCRQKALIEQVIEAIRIAKIQSRFKSEEFNNY